MPTLLSSILVSVGMTKRKKIYSSSAHKTNLCKVVERKVGWQWKFISAYQRDLYSKAPTFNTLLILLEVLLTLLQLLYFLPCCNYCTSYLAATTVLLTLLQLLCFLPSPCCAARMKIELPELELFPYFLSLHCSSICRYVAIDRENVLWDFKGIVSQD